MSLDQELADDLAIPSTSPDDEQQDWFTARLSNLDAATHGLETEEQEQQEEERTEP